MREPPRGAAHCIMFAGSVNSRHLPGFTPESIPEVGVVVIVSGKFPGGHGAADIPDRLSTPDRTPGWLRD
ncbi:MAG: hypothetical protein Q4C47_02430 [Planctomycetia bacterium]|nr:hypothetical protein [Planctomycetia bacterium]